MTAQRRAASGGEIGKNGEAYKGGQFIANTDHPKGQPKAKKYVSQKFALGYGLNVQAQTIALFAKC